MIASSKGKANFVRLLLEHGADINTDDAVSSTDRQNEYRGKVCANAINASCDLFQLVYLYLNIGQLDTPSFCF